MKDALAAATFSVENGEQTETPEHPVESGTVELSELQKQMQDILVDHYYIYSDFQVDENGNIRQDEQGNNLTLMRETRERNVILIAHIETCGNLWNISLESIYQQQIA